MKRKPKIVITFALTLSIVILFLFNMAIVDSNHVSHEDGNITKQFYNSNLLSNLNSESLSIMNPISYRQSLDYEGKELANFVLYQDFPLKIIPLSSTHDLKLVNVPENTWAKLIPNKEINHDNSSGITLRMMGAIKPFVPTPVNNTIFIVGSKDQNGLPFAASTTIVKNTIMTETSTVRDSLPVKFKNEIFTKDNSKFFIIYGIVYDKNVDSLSEYVTTGSSLKMNIEPVGLMYNGNLTSLPKWIEVKTMKLPLLLKQNQPDYYVVLISVTKAPSGSYELAFRESISEKIFIETMTLTILDK